MKKIQLLLAMLLIASMAQAQYKTLVLNYEKSCFGENEPLPTGKNFIITGTVNSNIAYVSVDIFSKKGMEKGDPIYTTFWKRDLNSKSLNFNIPINFKLRESKDYDVLIQYYRQTSEAERGKLYKDITATLDAYTDQAFKISDTELGLVNSKKQTLNDLNKVVVTGLSKYRTRTMLNFESFSDVVKLKLKQLEGLKLSKGVGKGSDRNARLAFKTKMMTELKTMLHTEIEQYISSDLSIMVDDKYIDDYPTESTQNYLPINIGYGGAMLNTDFNNFNYAAAPYIGLSVPFGKEGGRSAFWSKTSLSVGAFLMNMKDQNGVEYTGPIFKIPVYASLGYRAYRFIRINAGATFLENTGTGSLEIAPFVGISAEFNVAVKLAK